MHQNHPGVGRTLSGRMLAYDALNMNFREFKLQRDPNAPAITELIDYQQFCGIFRPPLKKRLFPYFLKGH